MGQQNMYSLAPQSRASSYVTVILSLLLALECSAGRCIKIKNRGDIAVDVAVAQWGGLLHGWKVWGWETIEPGNLLGNVVWHDSLHRQYAFAFRITRSNGESGFVRYEPKEGWLDKVNGSSTFRFGVVVGKEFERSGVPNRGETEAQDGHVLAPFSWLVKLGHGDWSDDEFIQIVIRPKETDLIAVPLTSVAPQVGADYDDPNTPLPVNNVPLDILLKGQWTMVPSDSIIMNIANTKLSEKLGHPTHVEEVQLNTIDFYSEPLSHGSVSIAQLKYKWLGQIVYTFVVFYSSNGTTNFVFLDGDGSTIHEINKSLGFEVNSAEVAYEYSKFFCSAIAGKEGPFVFLEPERRIFDEFVWNEIAPLTPVITRVGEGKWEFKNTLSHSNGVFNTRFQVHKNGKIEMLDDKPFRLLELEYTSVVEGIHRYYKKME